MATSPVWAPPSSRSWRRERLRLSRKRRARCAPGIRRWNRKRIRLRCMGSCIPYIGSFISASASAERRRPNWEIFCLSCGALRRRRGEASMLLEALRAEVLDANLELVRRGLVLYTFGNASAVSREDGLIAIKPSGVPYDKMTAADMVI